MKGGKRMRTLDTLKGVFEPVERSVKKRSDDDSEEEDDGYVWVDLFSPGELDDNDNSYRYDEDEVKLKECLDKKGSLTIHVQISILPCCLSLAGKRPTHEPEQEEVEDNNNLAKRIRTEAVNSLAEDIATLRDRAASDLTLTCQGKSFPVHKAILSARSDVFASMLSGMAGVGAASMGTPIRFNLPTGTDTMMKAGVEYGVKTR